MAAFFNLQMPFSFEKNFVRLFFNCGLNDIKKKFYLSDIEKDFEVSRQKDRIQFEQIKQVLPLHENLEFQDAIISRIVGLTKFNTDICYVGLQECIEVPLAGGWWFRTPWFRDVFEGILNSFETLMKIPEKKENLKGNIELALGYIGETTGCIFNRIPEYKNHEPSYNCTDATLLSFIAANKYIQKTNDSGLAQKVLESANKTISCFQKHNSEVCKPIDIDGCPRVDYESGL